MFANLAFYFVMYCQSERIVLKNGKICVQERSINWRRGLVNYHKLIDASWGYTVFVFLGVILTSLFVFGSIYWLICYTHGDFEPHHLPHMQKHSNFTPCIYHMNNWASCLLFSIETQYKVAYGIKATTDECPEAIFVNAVECLIGFVIQGFMTIITFSKMTKPKLRSNTLLFSKNALITHKNGDFYLSFRIGDLRKNHIFNVSCRAIYVTTFTTQEGELIRNDQALLNLESDGCKNGLFFNWPLIMEHKIDQMSPLWSFATGAKDQKFEIVVVMEGIMHSTGLMTQAMTSYIQSDIMWSGRFKEMVKFTKGTNEFEVDFSNFNSIIKI